MASATKRSWKLHDFTAHSSNVNCLALGHKSGRVLVTGGDDKKVNLWAVGKPNCIMSLSGHTTPVECVQFGYTEELVCAGSQAGALKIWDLEAAKILRTLTGHKSGIRCTDFHPYGDFLSSGSVDTYVKLWDIRRKGCIFTYKGHISTVNSLKFSPDGQWIASGGDEGIVKLWDLRMGKQLKAFEGHTDAVTAVKFHPNEFLLASSSTDHTVDFWDLENFQLVSTSEMDIGPIRCITFSQDGECLFSGSQELLKVHGWEPTRTFDTVPVTWGKVQDIAMANDQLIGASSHVRNVALHIVDLSKVQPFGGPPIVNSSPFVHGQSIRKSFSREKPLNPPKATLEVKTIEESDRSGTDPEDDSQSLADIQNVGDYRAIFRPNRNLCRTPPSEPFPAPPDEDPSQPQILQPRSLETEGSNSFGPHSLPSLDSLPPNVTVRAHQSPVRSRQLPPTSSVPAVPSERPETPESRSPQTQRSLRRLNSYKDQNTSFPEMDFPVKSNNIKHSPSEPALNRPNSSHSRSRSLSRNFPPLTNSSSTSSTVPPPTAPARHHSRPLDKPVTVRSRVSPPVETSIISNQEGPIIIPSEDEKDLREFVPMSSDKPAGLDMDDFLPKNYSKTFRNQHTFPDMSEAEVISSMMRGHESMMAVLHNRHRNLQIVSSVWVNKDLKAAVESAVNMNDLAVMVDILGIVTLRPSSWNLDLCVSILPTVLELIQSKYEMYMSAGCSALLLILRNFSSLIKTNVHAPIQTVGVDISREERYNKCLKCYNHMMSIRTFLLKRQTLQGKLGQTFRELQNLMQNLD